jgi:hypothetical protein
MTDAELIKNMAEHIAKNAPKDASMVWKYD